MKNQNFENMLMGKPYISDDYCQELMLDAKRKLYKFNNFDFQGDDWKQRLDELIIDVLDSVGENITVLPPFHCDFGKNIKVGKNFFANYNLTILDVAEVIIGDNVFIAPNVSIYTAGHPIHPKARNSMYEYGIPITIGDDCWIGGSVLICPGVNIGKGTVIGAGSVVTCDIPENVVAAGNPCRVLRKITDDDIKYYFKKREFSVEEMKKISG